MDQSESRANQPSISPYQRPKAILGSNTSRFGDLSPTSGDKEGILINLRQLNTHLPMEIDGFSINNRWAAVPLSLTAGAIAIFDVRKSGKIADGILFLENGANMTDFTWRPFDQQTLVAACDNGIVNFWTIDDNLDIIQSSLTKSFKAHEDKINIIKFNPITQNVLATAANNGEVTVWDTSSDVPKSGWSCLEASGHSILAMAWSSDGKYLATVSSNGILRLCEPSANNNNPLVGSSILERPMGACVMFVRNDSLLLISSVSISSGRMINLYSVSDLALVHSYPFCSSSSLLIPHYDFDRSIVFLTGKGDSTAHVVEVSEKAPYFLELSPVNFPCSHQGIAFVPENTSGIIGARLLLSGIEPLYKDTLLSNITRYEAVPDSPASETVKTTISNGKTYSIETNGVDLQNGNDRAVAIGGDKTPAVKKVKDDFTSHRNPLPSYSSIPSNTDTPSSASYSTPESVAKHEDTPLSDLRRRLAALEIQENPTTEASEIDCA